MWVIAGYLGLVQCYLIIGVVVIWVYGGRIVGVLIGLLAIYSLVVVVLLNWFGCCSLFLSVLCLCIGFLWWFLLVI